jgi:hypothetical protein
MSKRAEQAAALVLTALAALLHLLRLQHGGALWRDEAGAAQLASLPTFGEVYTSFPHEAFPLLFSGALRAYMGLFGDSDLAFRLLGLVVGLSILAALWWNARLAGALPLLSIVLIQLHPAFPLYGDSIRGYGLGTLLILLTFGAFARLVVQPDRKSILLALLPAVASVHLLLHNAALLAGIGLAAAAVGLLRRRFRVTVAALGIGLAAALTLLPYAGPLSAARDWRIVLIETVTLQEVLTKLAEVIGTPFPWLVWVWGGAALLAAAVTLRRALTAVQDDARLFRLLVIPAALGGEIAFLMVVGYSPRIWYLLPVLALVASALDGLLAVEIAAPARWARIAAASIVTAALYATSFDTATLRMTNVDHVARAVEQSAGPRDLVLVNEWYYGISFNRYYRGDTRWMTVPALADHRMHRFDLVKAKMKSADPLLEVRRAMRRTLRGGRRVWVVGRLEVPPDGNPVFALPPAPHGPWRWLDGPYSLMWTQQLGVFLETNTARKRRVIVPAGGKVSGMENLRIWVYQGWKPTPEISRQGPQSPASPADGAAGLSSPAFPCRERYSSTNRRRSGPARRMTERRSFIVVTSSSCSSTNQSRKRTPT